MNHFWCRHKKAFLRVFGNLPQRVLWKWDEKDIEDLPSNVRIVDWLNQQQVLGTFTQNKKNMVEHWSIIV